jgi:fibronectin type 3 domain-containing protein
MLACNNYNPATVNPPGKGALPAPTKILVKVGNGAVELTWVLESDTTLVKEYRVYRKSQNEASFRRIAAIKSRRYRDERLTNGQLLQYQIAAVNKSDVEGERSITVATTPAIYGIQLAGGARYANRRNVTITITAPASTTLMMFANDSAFAGADWEPFAVSRLWELTPGDGTKKVYAKFRNAGDQETSNPAKAEIILDTVAIIKSVEEDSKGRALKASEILHLRLIAGEKEGTATADIVDNVNGASGQERNIRLHDDGTNGDKTAKDGIYERDFSVRPGLEMVNAYVYGNFTDAAGNVAPVATAAGRVTIQSPPTAVVLQEPTTIAGSSTSLSLRWTPNTDNDFASYQIRRSRDGNVALSSILVKEFTDPKITSYVDNGLDPATKYFYRVYVFDSAANNSGSNIVQQSTPANDPPKPVVLSQPVEDGAALKLSWSPSTENDFANYRLYRSTAAVVDSGGAPIVVINNASTTEHRDTSVATNVTYYYRVYVFDQQGLPSRGSNIVQGKKPN